jgi:hypothetical protein
MAAATGVTAPAGMAPATCIPAAMAPVDPAGVERMGPHAKYGMIWINALRPPELLIELICDYSEV